ncbi:M20 family metallopeptidase [Amycolatopsis alkalitolerans]|uniref:M20 family metallopeptidase n=1 Tax=Amycolatopsis alkalitolerans TaxID=2547244 RepID=A0A5C4LTB8_9PSEU|nr:M20 family metallopeptidase [Amycolatopsis alkalitolerans]TNC21423.1 M20 family metallopeptidase [Amycolatopsis alkalitolerans]
MSRAAALDRAARYFDSGEFLTELAHRISHPTESQDPGRAPALREYLTGEMIPALTARLCGTARVVDNPAGDFPLLVASRHEGEGLPTVLVYGHGDVVLGEPERWRAGLDPWRVVVEGDRWYGRGTADNKGQHAINFAALEQVLHERGRLGFNLKVLLETGEESGSPGLRAVCAGLRDELAADVLIASDGPRVAADRPTLFLGSRGSTPFTLRVAERKGSYHSGNWGGLLRNPATVLAAALATIVDARGRILVPGLRPPEIPANVREALRDITFGGGPEDPQVDEGWGEPGLTPAERVVGWNSLEVLSLAAGNPDTPINAIPGAAHAHCQLRSVVGTEAEKLGVVLREHLDEHGFGMVEVEVGATMPATRTDPDDGWVRWALGSIGRTTGAKPALLPNLGGSIPNDAFADELGLCTLWIPHSYPACAQHSPDEHLLASVARESLLIMTGLFWDLGERPPSRSHP